MDVLIVNQREVPELLPMEACLEVMAEALSTLSRGDAIMPLRTVVPLPDHSGLLASMPSLLPQAGAMGIKVISVFPGNREAGLESHQGAVLLFEAERGRLLAIVDAASVTAIRTAAVSGLATRHLARRDAGDLAILGSGTQAATHLEAMLCVRPIRRVRVWSRDSGHAAAFAAAQSRRHRMEVETAPSAREAVAGADLICTTTGSPEPVLLGEWIAPGTHVNAIGAVGPANREVDTAGVVRSRLFVDRRESALNEAGEFVVPRDEGAMDDSHIAGELGEVVLGIVPARRHDDEVTMFRGVGLAVEDLAAVRYIHEQAVARGVGTRVELGGEYHEGG